MHEVPASTCPACGAATELATGILHHRAPNEGDVSVCIQCGALLVFDAQLVAVLAPPNVLERLDAEGRAHIEKARRYIHGRKPS